MSSEHHPTDTKTLRNRVVAGVCLAFFAGMVGMAYAAVPLYQMFCQMTGYGGTTQRVDQYSDRVLDRTITVRFDANVSGGVAVGFPAGGASGDDADRRDHRAASYKADQPVQDGRLAGALPSTSRRNWRAPISTRSSASASPTRP